MSCWFQRLLAHCLAHADDNLQQTILGDTHQACALMQKLRHHNRQHENMMLFAL